MEIPRTNADAPTADEKAAQPSALGLIILWQLVASPNHAYGLQKLLTSQGKQRVVNLRSRANLQQTIKRLQRLGLVEVHETVRGEGYPDRIVYAITDTGRDAARRWLQEMLAETTGEYPDFIAAVSILFGLEPDEARAQLEHRAAQLSDTLADTDAQLQGNPDLPRLFLLEEEYRKVVLTAQLSWLEGVIDDLRSGRLTWSQEWLAELFAAYHPVIAGLEDADAGVIAIDGEAVNHVRAKDRDVAMVFQILCAVSVSQRCSRTSRSACECASCPRPRSGAASRTSPRCWN